MRSSKLRRLLRGRTRPATPALLRFLSEHKNDRVGPDELRWVSSRLARSSPSTAVRSRRRPCPTWPGGPVSAGSAGCGSEGGESPGCNYDVYGPRKVWLLQINREGFPVARCTVEPLRNDRGLRGAHRGERFKTTVADPAARPDRRTCFNRRFAPRAPTGSGLPTTPSSLRDRGWTTWRS
jgi:hypothetical protein